MACFVVSVVHFSLDVLLEALVVHGWIRFVAPIISQRSLALIPIYIYIYIFLLTCKGSYVVCFTN